MSNGATHNYDFPSKRHWRRWVWNRIAERTDNPRDALVLFLAGPEALDLDVARSKGFRPQNMIAVERDPATVARLREAKVLTIEGDLNEVVTAWPMHKPVGVLLADLCGGLQHKNVGLAGVLCAHQAFQDSVIAVNLLRGRDPLGASLTREIQGTELRFDSVASKHRGAAFAASFLAFPTVAFPPSEAEAWVRLTTPWLRELAAPAMGTYKSSAGSLSFDSAVLRAPWSRVCSAIGHRPRFVPIDPSGQLRPTRGRIAAVLAHHTRGTYTPC